ncbi:MAG: hypothetical protein HY064_03340 [Bacteroidetes bacterium]|nr:hypothetical protein [Bacteroidota bacterium]
MTDDSVQADMMKKEAEQKFLDEELKKQCLEKENRLMYQRRNSISIIVIAVIIISLVIVGLIILIVVLSGRK